MYKIFAFLLFVLMACSQNVEPKYMGHEYVGVRYVNNPLGEEFWPDTDPLIRFDAFDCMTFVETVLADGNVDKLTQIRYKNGEIKFTNRNHFTELDWIPNNSDRVYDVTEKFGTVSTRNVTIDKKSWFKKTHNINTDFEPVTVSVKYVSYADLKPIKTDHELIVLFVIEDPKMRDKIGSDLSIAHMGFLLPNGMLRHASSKQESVVDVDFNEYVSARSKNKTHLGVAFYGIKND